MIKTGNSKQWLFKTPFLVPFLFFLFCSASLFAQPPLFRTYNYIDTYSQEAVRQMVEYKIPASVILAQAILESRSGSSDLAKRSNNHFGIKCHREWMGDTIIKNDDTLNECFRSYASIEESYTDHSLFLSCRPRYALLFSLPVYDFKAWCYGLKNSGYATSPYYAEELIKIIVDKKLYLLDGYQHLPSKLLLEKAVTGIKTSSSPERRPSLFELAQSAALFIDERDVLVQSLRLHAALKVGSAGEIAEK